MHKFLTILLLPICFILACNPIFNSKKPNLIERQLKIEQADTTSGVSSCHYWVSGKDSLDSLYFLILPKNEGSKKVYQFIEGYVNKKIQLNFGLRRLGKEDQFCNNSRGGNTGIIIDGWGLIYSGDSLEMKEIRETRNIFMIVTCGQ